MVLDMGPGRQLTLVLLAIMMTMMVTVIMIMTMTMMTVMSATTVNTDWAFSGVGVASVLGVLHVYFVYSSQ